MQFALFPFKFSAFFICLQRDIKDMNPLGAIYLTNYVVKKATEIQKPFAFKLEKYGQRTYFMYASSEDDMNK